MRKRDLSYALAMVIVVAGLVVPVNSANAASEEFTWKVQSVWARGDVSMETLAYFAERVRERSNGRLKIEVFAEPEIVPLPEVFPAC